MPVDAVEEVKSRLDIVEVISNYLRLQKSGREFKGLCPFHSEKSPSFTVNPERGVWYCFGCQEGGDIFAFVSKIEHLEFRGALELLAEKAGVDLVSAPRDAARSALKKRILELNGKAQAYFTHVLWETPAGEQGRKLLEERGVGRELADKFGIGFAPAGGPTQDALARYLIQKSAAKTDELVEGGLALLLRGDTVRDRFRGRLVFPIRDERGKTIGFGGRGIGDAIPKYLNSPETAVYHKSSAIFGLDLSREQISKSKTAVLVEGYFDVLAMWRAQVTNVVATSGTALAEAQVRTLDRMADTIVLCLDGDDAGRAAASRAVDLIAAAGLAAKIVELPAGMKDPDELVRRDPEGLKKCIDSARAEWEVLLERAIGNPTSIESRRESAARAIKLLSRIPEAATRDLYVQQAARKLEVEASALSTDVKASRSGEVRTPVSLTIPQKPQDLEKVVEPSSWESYLGAVVMHQPKVASGILLEAGLNPTWIESELVGRVIAKAQELGDVPMHEFPDSEQKLLAKWSVRTLPELEDGVQLQTSVADCLALIEEAYVGREMAGLKAKMRLAKDEGRDSDLLELAEKMNKLAKATPRLRRSLASQAK